MIFTYVNKRVQKNVKANEVTKVEFESSMFVDALNLRCQNRITSLEACYKKFLKSSDS